MSLGVTGTSVNVADGVSVGGTRVGKYAIEVGEDARVGVSTIIVGSGVAVNCCGSGIAGRIYRRVRFSPKKPRKPATSNKKPPNISRDHPWLIFLRLSLK